MFTHTLLFSLVLFTSSISRSGAFGEENESTPCPYNDVRGARGGERAGLISSGLRFVLGIK